MKDYPNVNEINLICFLYTFVVEPVFSSRYKGSPIWFKMTEGCQVLEDSETN
jgi:hypothetical protein